MRITTAIIIAYNGFLLPFQKTETPPPVFKRIGIVLNESRCNIILIQFFSLLQSNHRLDIKSIHPNRISQINVYSHFFFFFLFISMIVRCQRVIYIEQIFITKTNRMICSFFYTLFHFTFLDFTTTTTTTKARIHSIASLILSNSL